MSAMGNDAASRETSKKYALDLDGLDFDKGSGSVAVVAQDAHTSAVLMLAYADREALERSLATGLLHFRSRTRGLWLKGETSGHVLRIVELSADCDGDAVLARVEPAGPTCHTGAVTCWGGARVDALRELAQTIASRAADPAGEQPSYTRRLLGDRNLRLKKIGEEASELVVALADRDRERAAEEGADLFYHALVALAAEGVGLDEVLAVLAKRKR
jgi:phosphoribosyl-ATP pyrophosphohydrolase/phosphoribosyl-AMP cyclohydrolase